MIRSIITVIFLFNIHIMKYMLMRDKVHTLVYSNLKF